MNRFVLMLEGDKDDRYITQETLLELDIPVPIKFLSTSIELFDFLSSGTKPSLILIDYSSTPENGIEVLKKIKANGLHSDIPVVIISETDQARYKNECYALGASSFIKKPDTIERTNKKIASFFHYWFNVVEL